MRLFRSKKGLSESEVIIDIFSVLAYFVFFIIVVVLISQSGTKSKAEVTVQSVKIDQHLTFLNGLRTPIEINVTQGTVVNSINMTFAEYSAFIIDSVDCEDPSKTMSKDEENLFIKQVESVLKQMEPFFKEVEKINLCFRIVYSDSDSCKNDDLKLKKEIFSDMIEKRFDVLPICKQSLLHPYNDELTVTYPTMRKELVKAHFSSTMQIPIVN